MDQVKYRMEALYLRKFIRTVTRPHGTGWQILYIAKNYRTISGYHPGSWACQTHGNNLKEHLRVRFGKRNRAERRLDPLGIK
jgi:hypothetical protein